jgi:signal transduction histidine kinase
VAVKREIRGRSEAARDEAWRELADSVIALMAGGRPTPEAAAVIEAAQERAGGLARSGGLDREALNLAAVELVGAVLCGLLAERDWSRDEIGTIVIGTSKQLDVPAEVVAIAVFGRAIAEWHLFDVPPNLALEAQLRLFLAFAPVGEVSIWVRSGAGPAIECLARVGDAGPVRGIRAAARKALGGEIVGADRGPAQIHALPIVRWEHPEAALAFRTRPGQGDDAFAFARELAPRLVPTLERRSLLARLAARERSLAEATERRLARFGLDLHDGPIQDVLALGSELRLFRTQLARVLDGHEHAPILIGRVDDVDARLVALDRELRELARSLESPTVLKAPLPDLVREEVDAFTRRTRIEVDLDLDGSFDGLTASQGIALLRIVQEALQNVESHSGARHVRVALQGGRSELRAEVTDDGRGFEVERRLVQAAREGHLGLVGMGERVRLLGGRFDVRSARGGPTQVSAAIPRWTPPG